jgi:hypothetical protein
MTTIKYLIKREVEVALFVCVHVIASVSNFTYLIIPVSVD